MKKAFVLAAVLTALAGSGLHFLHEALPNVLTAVIAPVNESVWEHLKLLFWPTLAAAAVLSRRSARPAGLWSGFFAALLAMPLFLLGSYYLLRSLGAESLPLDIGLYFVTVFLGFRLAWLLQKSQAVEKAGGLLLFFVLLYGAVLILFTFAPPPLPIFTPSEAAFCPISWAEMTR